MKLLQYWKQKIKDSFYYFHQDRLQEKYYNLSGEWYDVSRQCYELKQQLNYYTHCVPSAKRDIYYYFLLKKYKRAYAKMCNLSKALRASQKEKNKSR